MLAVRAQEDQDTDEREVLGKEIGELIHFLLVFHDLQPQFRQALSFVMGRVKSSGSEFVENVTVDYE